jgi:hypothetical protein
MPPDETVRRRNGNRIRNELRVVAQIWLAVVLKYKFAGHERLKASGGLTDLVRTVGTLSLLEHQVN